MRLIYSIIYNPAINWLLRNISYILSPVLSEKIKIHPSGTIKIKVESHNPIKIKANQTSYVARQLFWNGSQNYEYTPIFIKLIKKVDTFFDIGSSIGYYSILGATVNDRLSVQAFEPSTGSMFYLTENVRINQLGERIKLNALALSDKSGKIDFYEIRNRKYPSIFNLSGEHNVGTKPNLISGKTSIESDTLDNFVKNHVVKNVDLIKLDTEGCEDAILLQAKETIDKYKPIIICEVLFNRIEATLEKIMLGHNYEFYNHIGDQLQKAEKLTRTEDDGIRNCFFVHPSKKHLIEEFVAS
jgi:FkbM family methyltransferase